MPTALVPAIEAVQGFVPSRSVAIEEVADRLGINRHQLRVFQRVHGLARLPMDPDLDLIDLLVAPARALVPSAADRERIRYLVYAHTAPDVAPAHVSAAQELCRRLDLPRATAFAVTQQNCASGLAAVDIAVRLLLADGDPGGRALVVTGEKASSRIFSVIPNTTVMGEGSAACLVGVAGAGRRIRSYAVRTRGEYAQLYRPRPEVLAEFFTSYTPAVVEIIRQAVHEAGLSPQEITMIVPHNVNNSSWRGVIRELGFGVERIYLDNVPRYGHCFGSDPFINLASMRDEGRLRDDGVYLLAAVGLGATYAAMVIGG
ncbi:ketoacyl-ACP synthase III family protein [Microbispora hainanensis]|jgi:3-oxoacyl-[acyl-carrier-protein] synthase-3|uniref:Ketoacyl-ACP synthase III family protein n=1 Tax=Microbispora hainanensis TaxID=568844 RepID=A0ABZ1SQ06_9ACTN|nr:MULTISPECIES: ketoacyl-ACP synthase III family protein [Microbispora]NJP26119.1 3-oxoacyl-ACP synthase [Microbispora sp. CL1-1]TQS12555.1 3-oxoacyl-ACP synthase [Microbispora sp. SCL1-1]